MDEGHTEDIIDGAPEDIDAAAQTNTHINREHDPVITEGEGLLARFEVADEALEARIEEKYGEGFSSRAKEVFSRKWDGLLEKGDGFLNWVEAKGLPLPKTKVGLQVLAGTTGVTGSVIPGLGVLLPVAYLLWQRSKNLAVPMNADPVGETS